MEKIELEDFNVDNVLLKSYHSVLKQRLDPIWNRVSAKTRQLINDLGELRKMANYLIEYDCVSFNRYLEIVRQEKYWSMTYSLNS